jgi:SH3-like domain-containing protein
VRVRTAPAGSAAILWTAPRGRSYILLDRAPGGWVQIGDGETALGWVHSSLLGPAP